jgi:nitric oxide reductase NorE protein
VLAICLAKARSDPMDARYVTWIEASGCYWHMVDMLWIVLFPMLYLLRSS